MSIYYEVRKNYRYYKYVRSLLSMIGLNAKSIIDVGSNGMDYISWLPCKNKVSIDLVNPLIDPNVKSIKADFLDYEFNETYDIVTCFQVLEHIPDKNVISFAKKLLKTGKIILISVPHKWPKGAQIDHLQDPVDYEKMIGWFGEKPVFIHNILEKEDSYKFGRMICVFLSSEYKDMKVKLSDLNNGAFSDFVDFDLENKYKEILVRSKEDAVKLNAKFKNMSDEYERLQKSRLVNENNKNIIYTDKKEILKIAKATNDVKYAQQIFMLGESIYPWWTDEYGHPCFFKEWVRYLLAKDEYDGALSLVKTKINFYKGIISEKDLKILFDRYKNAKNIS